MKAMVLFSGGLDSTTCLAMAVNKYGAENVIALSLQYGQKHNKEIECAKQIVKFYNVKQREFDVQKLFANANCTLLKTSDQEIPQESYKKQLEKTNGNPVSTYVPYRNGVFLSIAASLALTNNCQIVYYGAHKDDAAGNAYPDCSQNFNKYIAKAIFIGTNNKVTIKAPFINKNKADIVKKGLQLQVPYELTWSCYKGEDKPCGKCGTCIDRINAFKANGVVDPLLKKQ